MRHQRITHIGRAVALAAALTACGAPGYHASTERSSKLAVSLATNSQSLQAAQRCSRAITPHTGDSTWQAIGADLRSIPTCRASALFLSTASDLDAGTYYQATANMVSELQIAYSRVSPPNLDAPRFDQASRARLTRAVAAYQAIVP